MTTAPAPISGVSLFKKTFAEPDGDLNHILPVLPEAALVSEDSDDESSLAGRPRLRAIFISDLHIGTPGFQAEALLDFLKHHPSDVLYLVGDIVDGWQLRRRWFWPQSHNDVVSCAQRLSGDLCAR